MECQGNGSCIIQCCCNCFEDCICECNTNCIEEFDNNGCLLGCDGKCCNCLHIDNCEWINGIHKECTSIIEWCVVPANCQYNCELQKCNNFIICKTKHPEWYLDCHNGCCINCDINFGPLTFLEEESECCICFENKKMVKLICIHTFCFECITTLHKNECPLCRNKVYIKTNK